MKSAGPNTRASSRGDAAAIAFTAARPAAFSICASIPGRAGRQARLPLHLPEQQVGLYSVP